MIELLLELFIDIGLLRKDFKHHKKVSKKEKLEGKKSPFKKYVLQPSTKIYVSVIISICIGVFVCFSYQSRFIFPESTEKELAVISKRIHQWHQRFGAYPNDLKVLIGHSHTRQKWYKDAWRNPYQYTVTNNGKGFLIMSSGSDGKMYTKDDIKFEN